MNLNYVFFIVPLVFIILTIVFPLSITENIPKWLNVNIGELNADDIRGMDNGQRNYLRKQVSYHFLTAVAVTLLIGLIFFFFGKAETIWQIILCILLELVLGLAIALHVLKTARIIKTNMSAGVQ